MRRAGDNPLQAIQEQAPVVGDVDALRSIPGLLRQGHPFLATAAAASTIPGVPNLLSGLKGLKGVKVFARSEAPGTRRVAMVTKNTRPGEKPFRISVFEETVGEPPRARFHMDFVSEADALDAIRNPNPLTDLGGGDLQGFRPINRKQAEFSFERNTERAAMEAVEGDAARLRATTESRKRPGGFGGFFDPDLPGS
jgi:hypothetical protein